MIGAIFLGGRSPSSPPWPVSLEPWQLHFSVLRGPPPMTNNRTDSKRLKIHEKNQKNPRNPRVCWWFYVILQWEGRLSDGEAPNLIYSILILIISDHMLQTQLGQRIRNSVIFSNVSAFRGTLNKAPTCEKAGPIFVAERTLKTNPG